MSKSCLESSSTCILWLCEKGKPWRGHAYTYAGPSEPSPHADVIGTNISCADQFIVLIFHFGPLFYFLIQYYNLNS